MRCLTALIIVLRGIADMIFCVCAAVERVAIGQEESAPVPEPFEWDPNDE